jgi:hypothetical protein
VNWRQKWRVESGVTGDLLARFGSNYGALTIGPTRWKLTHAFWYRTPSPPDNDSETGGLDLILRLTLIDLLLRPMGPWFIRASLLLTSALGLIAPAVLRSPITWASTFVLIALRIALDWPLPDNHIYLLAYWCLAVAVALATNRAGSIATSARLLVGLAFLFAVLWKGVLSPEYRDGRFFAVTFLTDDRFADAVRLLGGLSESDLESNRTFLEPLPEGAAWFDKSLVETRAFRILVACATWSTLAIETAIALLFLLPLRSPLEAIRHIFLLGFCIVTYAFAPIAGFGWLLLVMGLAVCSAEQRRLRTTYVAVYFLILLYSEIPWAGLILDWRGQ